MYKIVYDVYKKKEVQSTRQDVAATRENSVTTQNIEHLVYAEMTLSLDITIGSRIH